MSEKTAKAFNTLHEKMLESEQYRQGYQAGLRSIRQLFAMSIEALKDSRRRHLGMHNQFAAGWARAMQEVIWQKMRLGGEAA